MPYISDAMGIDIDPDSEQVVPTMRTKYDLMIGALMADTLWILSADWPDKGIQAHDKKMATLRRKLDDKLLHFSDLSDDDRRRGYGWPDIYLYNKHVLEAIQRKEYSDRIVRTYWRGYFDGLTDKRQGKVLNE